MGVEELPKSLPKVLPYVLELLDQIKEEGSEEDPQGQDKRLRDTLRHLLMARSGKKADAALQRFAASQVQEQPGVAKLKTGWIGRRSKLVGVKKLPKVLNPST